MLQQCLEGVRVLDLSQYVPGPFATLILSDLGADVVKVEPPQGDPMAGFQPRDADGISPFYKQLNRNKTVVRLDLKGEEGKAAFTDMVAKADVVLESFRPGVLDRLGFGADRLREINPAIVHCALSGFGQNGPNRLRAGHDITYLALTGALAATGPAEAPAVPFPPAADHAGAVHAVIAILGALLRRQRTGEGGSLDVSLFESALHLSYLGLTLGRAGRLDREGDLLNGGAAFYRCYRCRDGRFAALGAIEPKFWQAFCTAVGRPDWIDRQAEPLPQTALAADVAEVFAARDLAEWEAVLGPVDCCFESVLEVERVPGHPHVVARGLIPAESPGDGAVDVLFPAFFDGAAPPPRRPLSGLNAQEILRKWS